MNNYLATNLRYLRKQNSMKQTDVSIILGCSYTAVANWELKKREPDIETLIKLASIYRVNIDDLLKKDLRTTKYKETISSKEYINNQVEECDFSPTKKKLIKNFLKTLMELDQNNTLESDSKKDYQ